jgi:hypothetical protein
MSEKKKAARVMWRAHTRRAHLKTLANNIVAMWRYIVDCVLGTYTSEDARAERTAMMERAAYLVMIDPRRAREEGRRARSALIGGVGEMKARLEANADHDFGLSKIRGAREVLSATLAELEVVLDGEELPEPVDPLRLVCGEVVVVREKKIERRLMAMGPGEVHHSSSGAEVLVVCEDVEGVEQVLHVPLGWRVLACRHSVYAPRRMDTLEVYRGGVWTQVEAEPEPVEVLGVGGDLEEGGLVLVDDGPVDDGDYYKWGA